LDKILEQKCKQDMKVIDFKRALHPRIQMAAGVLTVAHMRIVSKGTIWEDDKSISEYGLVDNDEVFLLRNMEQSAAGADPLAAMFRDIGATGSPGGTNNANPAANNAFASLMQGLQAGGVPPPAGAAANPFAHFAQGAGGGANPWANLLGGGGLGGLGGAGAGGFPAPAAPQDTRPARERYAAQLTQLTSMGISEEDGIRALEATNGDVNRAMENLFGA